jgi:L-asparaginase/Glu-tRNA(Gln) amidotransferase subunit D
MAGTSSNVAMMLGPDLPFPVGFFGAQKTLGNVPTDVQANTVTALQSIKHLKRDNINTVFVAMGGTSGGAYLAVGVDKVNDDRMVGFSSPAHPKILDSDNFFAYGSRFDFKDRYIGLQPGRQTSTLRSTEKKWFPVISRGYSPVLSITPKMGHDPDVIRRIVEVTPELKYVSLTTFGSFTTNSKIQDAILTIKDVQEGKRMVIAANPFPEGSTDHKYETTRRMKESGLIVPTAVLPIALEAKLMVADRVIGSDRSDVVDFLNSTNYVGEQPLGHWNSLASEGDVQFGLPNGFPRILHRGKIPEDSRLD